MNKQTCCEYSGNLAREMSFNVYGSGGKPVLVIPCQAGRYYEWEGFGMLDVLDQWLSGGEIQLFCVDTIDNESVAAQSGDPSVRVRMQERWYNYVVNELVPRIHEINKTDQGILVVGFSMGAYHAGNFFFRRPDLFDSVIALSGIYDTNAMYDGYMDAVVYANDPCASIINMPKDHPYIQMFNDRKMVFCVGQGAWEDELLAGTRRLEQVLRKKGINAWVDYWGTDVNHDWPWWKKQMQYFLPYVLNK